jgi:hypothetical protein
VQISLVVDALRVGRVPGWRVPGGAQWQLGKAELASIRSPRNGMPWRGGGLRIYASSNTAVDGNAIARRNSSPSSFTRPSASPRVGRRLPTAHLHLLPAQICGPSYNEIDRGAADIGAAGHTPGQCAESKTGRRLADPQLCIVSLDWPKWREPEQICPGIPQPRSTLSDRIPRGGVRRGHHDRTSGHAGIHV